MSDDNDITDSEFMELDPGQRTRKIQMAEQRTHPLSGEKYRLDQKLLYCKGINYGIQDEKDHAEVRARLAKQEERVKHLTEVHARANEAEARARAKKFAEDDARRTRELAAENGRRSKLSDDK